MSSQPGKARFPRGRFLVGFAVLTLLATTEALAPESCEVDGGVSEEPERTPVDTQRSGGIAGKAGPAVPVKPEEWMKRAPCLPDAEEAINGACFVRTAKTPPCPRSFYEHAGGCFVAVAKVPRPPTSIEE